MASEEKTTVSEEQVKIITTLLTQVKKDKITKTFAYKISFGFR